MSCYLAQRTSCFSTMFSARQLSSSNFRSYDGLTLKKELYRGRHVKLFHGRTRNYEIRVLANPNASPGKGSSKKEVIMVDPLEAKRLAAKQMEQIKTREKFKKRRQIEAINGAWAMIGITAALVIEGQTGKSILEQLVGYWDAFVHFFPR